MHFLCVKEFLYVAGKLSANYCSGSLKHMRDGQRSLWLRGLLAITSGSATSSLVPSQVAR
jgi:hypothetical protein